LTANAIRVASEIRLQRERLRPASALQAESPSMTARVFKPEHESVHDTWMCAISSPPSTWAAPSDDHERITATVRLHRSDHQGSMAA
jgi:hypothetical protein